MIELCGLWTKKDKNDNPMLSGKIGQRATVLILKNQHKKEEKHPDYFLYLSEAQKPEGKEEKPPF